MNQKNIDITFLCLPPSEITIPSPAFSVLSSYLRSANILSQTIYVNHIFASKIKKIDFGDTYQDGNEIFLPFLSMLDEIYMGGNSKYIRTYCECSFPKLFLSDRSLFGELIKDLEKECNDIIDDTIDMIKKNHSKFVGITSKFHQWIPSILFAYKIKQRIPDIKIISGGWTNSQAAYNFLKLNSDIVDYAIWGEGEIPLHRLINNSLPACTVDLDHIPRLIYKSNGKIKKTTAGSIDSYVDFSIGLHVPDYTDFFDSCSELGLKGNIYPIERGRGCNWNKCSFCYLAQGYKYRLKTADIIIQEVEYIVIKYDIYDFFFTDNDIIGEDRNEFDKLLDKLILLRNKYPRINFVMAEVISKDLSWELINKMAKAGFESIQIGIEAISEDLLIDINKKQSIIDNFFTVKTAISNGIIIKGANIIMNTPNETNDMIIESINNLYNYRFVLVNKEFNFDMVQLAVSNYSKYLRQIKNGGDDHLWCFSNFEKLLDRKYNDDIDRFSLMDFNTSLRANPLWAQFNKALKFYKKNQYTYKIKFEQMNLHYNEYVNGEVIKDIIFENEVYGIILHILNRKIVQRKILFEKAKLQGAGVSDQVISSCFFDLQSQGLIFMDKRFENVVSLIDFNL